MKYMYFIKAYVFEQCAQGGAGAGPAEGDARAVELLAEMEDDSWASGKLTDDDRIGELSFETRIRRYTGGVWLQGWSPRGVYPVWSSLVG